MLWLWTILSKAPPKALRSCEAREFCYQKKKRFCDHAVELDSSISFVFSSSSPLVVEREQPGVEVALTPDLCGAPSAAAAAGIVLDVFRTVGEPDPDIPLVPQPAGVAADL